MLKIRSKTTVFHHHTDRTVSVWVRIMVIVFLIAAIFYAELAFAEDHGDTQAEAEFLAEDATLSQYGFWDWDNNWGYTSDKEDGDWYKVTITTGASYKFTINREDGRLRFILHGSVTGTYPGAYSWWESESSYELTFTLTAGDYYIQILNDRDGSSFFSPYPYFSITYAQDNSGMSIYYRDADGDTYGDPGNTGSFADQATAASAGYVLDNTDCDDSRASVNPGITTETCDQLDNDCDGSVDEGLATNTYYRDDDNDGYGVTSQTTTACTAPAHYSAQSGDCKDDDSQINPSAYEICGNGIDENCDNQDAACSADNVCADLAEIPLETKIDAAPPIVMLLLDDSGSMDFDVVCPEPGGEFNDEYEVRDAKTGWKSQWAGYNGIYYDPDVTYKPWAGGSYTDSNPDNPKSHPNGSDWEWGYYNGGTYSLDSTFVTIDGVSVKLSHYYVQSSNGHAYLVNLSNNSGTYSASYYKVSSYGTHGWIQNFYSVSPPPDDVLVADPAAERQNFANWFTYHRTRELVAKAALGEVVVNSSGIKIGIHTLNGSKKEPVRLVDDYLSDILEDLYGVGAQGGTALRKGLEDVGQYLHSYDGNDGNLGSAPWSSDVDGGTCQRAFVIVMTDGYYNGDSPSVGNADYDNGVPYADSYSNTLADVAMKYYETDLNNTLDDKLTTNDLDTAEHQHMVTYSVSFGLTGTVDPGDYPNCIAGAPEGACPSWTNPSYGNDQKVDDLWHASVNGRGEFYAATNAIELADSLKNIFRDMGHREGQGASVAVNTQTLEENTAMYQGIYNSAGWIGDLYAYAIDPSTGKVADPDDYTWSAKEKLNALVDGNSGTGWNDRTIFTYDSGNKLTLPFREDSLSTAMEGMLSSNATVRQKLINYIRGDSSNDIAHGGSFRSRLAVLGDIIHSAPVHYGNYIYVGANDGMLHAFNATTGQEKFAYIPGIVFNNLKELSAPSYTHKYYVDNTVYIKTLDDKTYLIGSLGRGGRGVYGIDITNPDSITESNLPKTWEYSADAQADNDLGYTFSQVYLEKSNDPNHPNILIFSNGYDSANGKAVLYILDTDTNNNLRVLKKIDTTIGDSGSGCNGLSTPALVDIDHNRTVDYIYAGDLQGNLWKFDLTSSDYNNWHVFYGTASAPKPLFQAKNAYGAAQSIFAKPAIREHCLTNMAGYLIIFGTGKYISNSDYASTTTQSIYGIWDWSDVWQAKGEDPTGYYLGYLKAPDANGVRRLSNVESKITDENTSLLEQTQTSATSEWRYISDNLINWFSPGDWLHAKNDAGYSYSESGYGEHLGWFFDLPLSGERVITKPTIRTSRGGKSRVFTVSLVPLNTPCSTGGNTILHALSSCSGGQMGDPQFDVNDDGIIDDNDRSNNDSDDGDDDSDNDTPTNDDPGPSGKILDDIYFDPVIIDTGKGIDMMYFAPTEQESTRSESVGMTYWWMN